MPKFSVIQGDARSARLCSLLREDGREARLFSPEEKTDAVRWGDIVVLPIKGIDSEAMNGLMSDAQELVDKGDFLSREDFMIPNAVATAEGALELAMREMQVTLHGAKALVIGYGRIGALLCRSLSALGALVSCATRRDDHAAWLRTAGIPSLHTLRMGGALGGFEVVFNTAPHLVLPYARLRELPERCLLIDLASPPGGIDFKAAEKLGLSAVWALSLPGKCAPESAARYMRDTLYCILKERGVAL